MCLSSSHAVDRLNFIHYQLVEIFLVGHFNHDKYVRTTPARVRHFDSWKAGDCASDPARLARDGRDHHVRSHAPSSLLELSISLLLPLSADARPRPCIETCLRNR